MYEFPLSSLDLFQKYQVDYVIISSWERNSYQVDEKAFDDAFECVLKEGDMKLYRITSDLSPS